MQTNHANAPGQAIKQRSTEDGPWAWVNKQTLRTLTETFTESGQGASARTLYLALAELASDHQSESFTVAKALIAHKASLGVRLVTELLPKLESMSVITIDRHAANGMDLPSTYTLIAGVHLMHTAVHLTGQDSNADKVEESKKNLQKNKKKKSPAPTARETDRPSVPRSNGAQDVEAGLVRLEGSFRHLIPFNLDVRDEWRKYQEFCRIKGRTPKFANFEKKGLPNAVELAESIRQSGPKANLGTPRPATIAAHQGHNFERPEPHTGPMDPKDPLYYRQFLENEERAYIPHSIASHELRKEFKESLIEDEGWREFAASKNLGDVHQWYGKHDLIEEFFASPFCDWPNPPRWDEFLLKKGCEHGRYCIAADSLKAEFEAYLATGKVSVKSFAEIKQMQEAELHRKTSKYGI